MISGADWSPDWEKIMWLQPDTGRYSDITLEGVLALDPDVILFSPPVFVGAEAVATVTAAVQELPLWAEMRAVQEGRVILPENDLRPDSVLTIGAYLDLIAPLLYPETFPNSPLTEAEVRSALQDS